MPCQGFFVGLPCQAVGTRVDASSQVGGQAPISASVQETVAWRERDGREEEDGEAD